MENLKLLRIKYNMTQKELGSKLGTSGQTILNWENGIHFPSREKLIDIADLFNCSIDYLLDRDNINFFSSTDVYNLIQEISSEKFAKFILENIKRN